MLYEIVIQSETWKQTFFFVCVFCVSQRRTASWCLRWCCSASWRRFWWRISLIKTQLSTGGEGWRTKTHQQVQQIFMGVVFFCGTFYLLNVVSVAALTVWCFLDSEKKRRTCCSCCSCIYKVSAGEKQHELLPVAEEVQHHIICFSFFITEKTWLSKYLSSRLVTHFLACVQVNSVGQSGDSHILLLILEELKELKETVNLHLNYRMDGGKYVLLAARINRVFFIFYVSTVSLFLCFIAIEWHS